MSFTPILSPTTRAATMIRTFLLAALLPLLALLPGAAAAQKLYYNIAHAVNHSQYIDWAIRNGANGIEADLRFTEAGQPVRFQHGTICECQFPQWGFLLWNQTAICTQMMKNDKTYRPDPDSPKTETVNSSEDACNVNETARGFLNTLAKKPIALFIVDSKVGGTVGKNDADRTAAGKAVIALLQKELFDKGYQGKVIVGVDKSAYRKYTEAAVAAARGTPYVDRIVFSFDEDGNSYPLPLTPSSAELTLARLKEIAPGKAVYGNGISANLTSSFVYSFSKGVLAEAAREVNLNYVWTLDKPDAMNSYLSLGVRGIMTNDPSQMKKAVQPYLDQGGRMARPGDPL